MMSRLEIWFQERSNRSQKVDKAYLTPRSSDRRCRCGDSRGISPAGCYRSRKGQRAITSRLAHYPPVGATLPSPAKRNQTQSGENSHGSDQSCGLPGQATYSIKLTLFTEQRSHMKPDKRTRTYGFGRRSLGQVSA